MLAVSEIFKSIQGESTYAGCPCVFVRVNGCNLDCSYCDTPYARNKEAESLSVERIVEIVDGYACTLVEITGGEPLYQPRTPHLCRLLCNRGYRVLVETNGSYDIAVLPLECIRIVDIKTPSSGMADTFITANIDELQPHDQCKLVIGDRADFEWACERIDAYELDDRCEIIFSPVFGTLAPATLAAWILDQNRRVRLGLPLHKIIWDPSARGV